MSVALYKQISLDDNRLRGKSLRDYSNYLKKCKTEFDQRLSTKFCSNVTMADFCLKTAIGRGSFSVVLLATDKTENYYAMKVLSKEKIVKKKILEQALNEKRIISSVNFPFCLRLEYFFKDNSFLYYVFPYMVGGDMHTLMRKYTIDQDPRAPRPDVVHRDLKPENIVIDSGGYIKLADFGFSKTITTRTWTLCGTPEYMAPEIILHNGYGKSVDWWSFGIFIFELFAGYTPFVARSVLDMFEKIASVEFTFPHTVPPEAQDLVSLLLQKDLSRRYGNLQRGPLDIKCHPFFKTTRWHAIFNKLIRAPYLPPSEPGDTSNFYTCDIPHMPQSTVETYGIVFDDF